MNIDERKQFTNTTVQNLILESRSKLRINKLSIDTSEVIVEGDISSLAYSEKDYDKKGTSLFGKIFK